MAGSDNSWEEEVVHKLPSNGHDRRPVPGLDPGSSSCLLAGVHVSVSVSVSVSVHVSVSVSLYICVCVCLHTSRLSFSDVVGVGVGPVRTGPKTVLP